MLPGVPGQAVYETKSKLNIRGDEAQVKSELLTGRSVRFFGQHPLVV